MLHSELYELAELAKEAPTLRNDINELKLKVENLTNSLTNNKDCPWVVLRVAAKGIGISPSALRQRIKRHQYPENIVWRQKEPTGKISINMTAIGEYL
tara:strand:+ start:6750 stop:7043 length:294 start_codon:yes stop_codon:yes gene_type:complete